MSSPSEMPDDPEAFNPFEMLPDVPILHIFSFLPGADLLKLSEMDKNFNRIVTVSSKTMSKIRLVLNFCRRDGLDLDFVIKLAQTRRFTALKLISVGKLTDADAKVKLFSLLESLSGSVDDLVIQDQDVVPRELLASIIATFLPKLKKFKLKLDFCFPFGAQGASNIAVSSRQSNVNHPLVSLDLDCLHVGKVLHLFTGCNQIKTFCYTGYHYQHAADTELFKDFLATQEHLEKLIVECFGLPWNRLKCFQLKELTAYTLDADDEHAAAEFLKKLPKLTKLDIAARHSRPLMEAICRVPKLEKLTLRGWRCDDDGTLERLENRTVKELHIHDSSGITASLPKVFLGVESVVLTVWTDELDLSDVPPETIKKIELYKDEIYEFVVKFSPSDIPAGLEQFESALMKFAEEFSTCIIGIEIGHESWRNSGEVRLSNSFCEGLVNRLPGLIKLKIYNIEDSGRFKKFLRESEDRLILEDVELYEPFGVGEPKPKKMKLKIHY